VLTELRISGMGVIESTEIVLGPGLTALTGETGAGKTMLVEAISLLVGGVPIRRSSATDMPRRGSRVGSCSTTTSWSWRA